MTTKLNSRNIDDIQVFFVKQCYGYPRGDLVNGFAINEFMANGGLQSAPSGHAWAANNFFVSSHHLAFTVAHELGHVLTNAGHYGLNLGSPQDYGDSAPTHMVEHNLMKVFGHHLENYQFGSRRRLYQFQQDLVLQHRALQAP